MLLTWKVETSSRRAWSGSVLSRPFPSRQAGAEQNMSTTIGTAEDDAASCEGRSARVAPRPQMWQLAKTVWGSVAWDGSGWCSGPIACMSQIAYCSPRPGSCGGLRPAFCLPPPASCILHPACLVRSGCCQPVSLHSFCFCCVLRLVRTWASELSPTLTVRLVLVLGLAVALVLRGGSGPMHPVSRHESQSASQTFPFQPRRIRVLRVLTSGPNSWRAGPEPPTPYPRPPRKHGDRGSSICARLSVLHNSRAKAAAAAACTHALHPGSPGSPSYNEA